ncbi:hypothetical protein FCM35_KLT17056 [Carex littledalei]|uniref:Uncharacterized protein n=1 Tax=Carex littledalei TaxID=544730 RepID=A0A833VZ70_9POAL|nr:hypothetical protein FCM35_KLT17056 [Carex littledalei]
MSKSHISESKESGGGNGYYTVGHTATATVVGDDDTKPDSVLLQHAFEMETQGTMPWSTGLCHCFDDPRNFSNFLNCGWHANMEKQGQAAMLPPQLQDPMTRSPSKSS